LFPNASPLNPDELNPDNPPPPPNPDNPVDFG